MTNRDMAMKWLEAKYKGETKWFELAKGNLLTIVLKTMGGIQELNKEMEEAGSLTDDVNNKFKESFNELREMGLKI